MKELKIVFKMSYHTSRSVERADCKVEKEFWLFSGPPSGQLKNYNDVINVVEPENVILY
jgi:hypothetical protein